MPILIFLSLSHLLFDHLRELAFQIQKEYERFSKYLPDVKSKVYYGGMYGNNSYGIFLITEVLT